MDVSLLRETLLSPPVLSFALGAGAAFARSDLEIPQPIARFLSLYLMFAIGIHGGHGLHETGLSVSIALVLLAAMLLALLVPVYTFFILRWRLDVYNAGAIAATYGSVSAVTFVTASAVVTSLGIQSGGHMVAALALMESPAIVMGVLLVRRSLGSHGGSGTDLWRVTREAAVSGPLVLIVGSLLIGFLAGDAGWRQLAPFTDGIFRGMLSLFLLDMGIIAARRAKDLSASGAFLPLFAIVVPLVNAALGLGLAYALGLAEGDAILFMTLAASASYIAVPAAMRMAMPEANPSLYVSMALALTFPFNIVIGIPLYVWIVRLLWS